ncbi:MAG: molybdate ABC transporter substrate-binding protein [Actinomycetota bacterium]|nr:molybdate ABC transporter substrate-binding protein [Actinomycetota bacterium]
MFPGVRSARLLPAAGIAAAVTVLPGCAGTGTESPQLVVYAAASLSGVFEHIGDEFEAATGAHVVLNFAGSSDLLAQLEQGASADVLATADERTMDAASEAGLLAGPPEIFARNSLAVALAPGNPAGIHSLEDLAGDVLLVVCAAQVPCGNATGLFAERASLALSPVSEESSVSDVLAKVGSGEADAGIVYRTDLGRAAAGVEELEIPEAVNVTTSYPIAALGTRTGSLGGEFIDFVLGPAGQRLLAEAGFEVLP